MRKPTRVFFLASFFGVKLNIALQVLMPTVAFPSPGSWSADRLCSTAEFPCHVWLAADVRASYSHCEDKQVGRGGCCLLAWEVAVQALQSAQNSLCTQCGFPCKACCSCSQGFLSITNHMWQEAHLVGRKTARWQCGFCMNFLGVSASL